MGTFTQVTTFVNGQTADGGEVNTEVVNLGTSVNNIVNAQIASNAAIAISKTALGTFTVWTAFTPTWTGLSGATTLGTGILSARYTQLGKIIIAHYYLKFAADTSTAGAGVWTFTFPVAQNTSQQLWNGVAIVYNDDTSAWTQAMAVPNGNTTFYMPINSTAYISEGSPMVWAVNDICRVTIIYEAA